ncbi:MAG: formylglycine-generating enzyme family protein [Treponema sp.]|nr:formylglycine-generating enzyme family protein [Treponema sp.]
MENDGNSGLSEEFILIGGGGMESFYISKYEVTQELYKSVTGETPSVFKGNQRPVENVSWYDAIRFCNMLSKKEGKAPVYSVDGNTDADCWKYMVHSGLSIVPSSRAILTFANTVRNGLNIVGRKIKMDIYADGYRLPTREKWHFAAARGKGYAYAGSDDIDEIAWHDGNSGNETHDVGQKKGNVYGLYDMYGNVWEWCWDSFDLGEYDCRRWFCGGCCGESADLWKPVNGDGEFPELPGSRCKYIGFRVAVSK